jgi:uncharacterized protein YyaL (SSP411 family)
VQTPGTADAPVRQAYSTDLVASAPRAERALALTDYLELAHQTHRYSLRTFGFLPSSARSCARAPFLSYRRSDAEPGWADLWYVATQIGADAALLRADPSLDCCPLEKAACFVDRLFEPGGGGYLGRATPDARTVLGPDRYVDDQAHLGLMLLDAYEVTGDAAHLARAERAADYLLNGGVWDDQFGGGFWWNNRRGDSAEGKPTQANGLAADLFIRLHGQTGAARYRAAAARTLDFLDSTLFDSEAGLYRWSIAYATPSRRRGRVVAERFFNYDQAIIIQALLDWHQLVVAEPAFIRRALALAERLEPVFWHRPQGGFNLEAGVEQVFAIYAAWLSPALANLTAVAGDPRWFDLAGRNVAALTDYLRASPDGWHQSARLEAGSWIVDQTRDGVANAGLQWALAALAAQQRDLEGGLIDA